MQVRKAMTPDPLYVAESAGVVEAARMMRDNDLGFLPVECDDRMVGMITDRDIALRVVGDGRDPGTTPVGEVMSAGVLYCFDDETLEDAARSMAGMQVRRLPVIDRDKRLVGVISLGDLGEAANLELGGKVLTDVTRPTVEARA